MNTRIEELAKQADYEAPGGEWKKYFAELIVRECAKFLDENSGYDERNNAWHPASEDLLEHFGVK